MSLEEESIGEENILPLLELPILVLEKVIGFITDPYDLKALRSTCTVFRDIVNNTPEVLIYLKVVLRDLKTLENVVASKDWIKWTNFHFPPELYYVGCRRHYVDTFNKLFSNFATGFSSHIQKLEMDRFDLSNVHHLHLLKSCRKLEYFKADAMLLKGVKEQTLSEILEDTSLLSVLANLKHLDVTAFEFLSHDYQFLFMGKFLQKCVNLETLGSWGYFPEWEQPVGGTTHLKYFLWPLVTYLRRRFPVVDLMMECVDTPADLSNLNLQYLNDSMDWQSGKWILDLGKDASHRSSDSNHCSNLELFLYSRIKSYLHRAVGWFDEPEFSKAGLSLMTNLTTVRIHNARDIKLEAESTIFDKTLFPKLQNLTLIVGNRLSCSSCESESEADGGGGNLALEKVVVDMLLSTYRPTVTNLALDIDLDHHQRYGSIHLPSVIRNFPNLHYCNIEEWGPTDCQMLEIYEAFPLLEVLMFCGRNLTDVGILGNEATNSGSAVGICKLQKLKILKIFSIRVPPKNVFPWPSKENDHITDLSFQNGFSRMCLRKFHFLIKSQKISTAGLESLAEGDFSKSAHEFAMNWLITGIESVDTFEKIHPTFKFLDPQSEPANFVIPDIGKWVL